MKYAAEDDEAVCLVPTPPKPGPSRLDRLAASRNLVVVDNGPLPEYHDVWVQDAVTGDREAYAARDGRQHFPLGVPVRIDAGGCVVLAETPTPPRESSLSRNTIETLLVADRDEARGQRDHARFMAAGWRRLARVEAGMGDLSGHAFDQVDGECQVLTAYAVRLYRELDRTQGGAVARTIMRDLLAEVPSVASSLTLREQGQIEKGEGWK